MYHRTHTNTAPNGIDSPSELESLLDKKPQSGTSGLAKALFLVVNSVLGAGILAMSYACRQSGIIPYIIIVFLTGFGLVLFSIDLLLICCDFVDGTSYEEIGYGCMGEFGRILSAVSIWMQNTVQMTSYIVIIGDLLPNIMTVLLGPESMWCDRTLLTCLVVGVIVFPLACLRKISYLAYSSVFSISCSILFTIMVIYEQSKIACPLPNLPGPPGDTDYCDVKLFNISEGTFFSMPTVIIAFVCHPTVMPTYRELRNRSRKRMGQVVLGSMIICVSVYLLVALFGYLTFRGAVQGDLLKMYSILYQDGSTAGVFVTQIAVCCSVCFIIPLIHYSTRNAIELTLFSTKEFSWIRHVVEAALLVGVSLAIALAVADLDTVLAVGGSSAGFMVFCILPCLFYLVLSHRLEKKGNGWWTKRRFAAVVVLILSVGLAVANTIGVFVALLS